MRFACSVSEAVGIDPWDDDGPIAPLPVPAPLLTIKYVRVTPPPRPPRPPRRGPNPNQLALDLAA